MLDHAHRSKGFINPTNRWDWASLQRAAFSEARRILRDDGHAEDAAQEALIRAWRYAARCADPAHPTPWLRAIARREALRMLSKAEPVPVDDADEVPAPSNALHDAIDIRATIGQALSELDRRLLHSRYWLGMTHHEIAHDCGLPIGTVKTRLHRARRKLRPKLAPV